MVRNAPMMIKIPENKNEKKLMLNNPSQTQQSQAHSSEALRLSVSPVGLGVESLPGLSATSGGLVELVTLVETSGLLASGGETAELSVLVHWLGDPVDAGIAADSLVLWVDEDDFVVLVGGVLVDPVRVEDSQVGAATTDTLLSDRTEGSLELELVHTIIIRQYFVLPSVFRDADSTHPWLVGFP